MARRVLIAASLAVLVAMPALAQQKSTAAKEKSTAAQQKAASAAHQFTDPAPGSIALMLSKEGYVLGADGPWRPHVIPFIAYDQLATWGAGFKGSPILGPPPSTFRPYEPVTIAIPVSHWSDGSPAPK